MLRLSGQPPRCYDASDAAGSATTLIIRTIYLRALAALLLLGFLAPGAADDATDENLQILGWIENAYLVAPGFEVRAKLDTGANTSSLDARIIKRFRQWGRRWVRFAVRHPETGEETVMVRERRRTIGIVQHEGDNDVRPTVRIEICIAGRLMDVEVSLTDRTNFNYPLLLGRRALGRLALVDSGQTFLSDATCPADLEHARIVLDPSATDPDRGGEDEDDRRSDQ